MAKAQGKAKGGKPAASTTTTRKTASKATASRKSGKPAAKKPAARKPAARAPAAKPAPKQSAGLKTHKGKKDKGPSPEAECLIPLEKFSKRKVQAPPKKTKKKAPTPPSLEVDDCLLDEDRFDEPVSLRAAIVIELGDYKGMGYLTAMHGISELVIPPKPDGYATRREIFEAVDAALDAPLSEHGVEGLSLSVRDCYVDQDCDGMWVTEVTEDTVTAACQYCS